MNSLKHNLWLALASTTYLLSPFSLSATSTKEDLSPNVLALKETSRGFTEVAKKAMPAVLFIKVESEEETSSLDHYQNPFDFNEDLFNRFFGIPPKNRQSKPTPQMSQGSGFLVSEDGYIMTNAHVVKGASKITAVFNDGKEMVATLVGSDPQTDIAIIKIEGKNLPYLHLGDSDEMEIGEWVIAIGSPFQLEASLTVGVISAKGRQNLRITDLEDFIQTDAAINPGNSGGPLLNLKSEVIGINTAIVSRSGGYMGIGFAVPSNMSKNVMDQLISKGSVTRAFLGVSLQAVDKEIAEAFNLDKIEGVLIADITKDSPADKAGLKQGDILLQCDNQPIKSLGGFRNQISMTPPGKEVELMINRKGSTKKIRVQLGQAADRKSESVLMQKIGLELENLSPDLAFSLGLDKKETGLVVTKVKAGSPAAMAGLRPGFLILQVNHDPVKSLDDFSRIISNLGKNKRLILLVKQGYNMKFYTIKLED
ncbi:MAG: DegQ family serine endoprotease [Rhabdochlamydiaceae bacterium]